MLVVTTPLRERLSPEGKELFDDVNLQRVLGASTHIRLIGDLFLNIAETETFGEDMLHLVQGIAEHFSATRGESSQAISNAIKQMTSGLTDCTADNAAESIRRGVQEYRESSAEDINKIKEYLWTVLEDKKNIFLFDYSSTVAAAAQMGKEHGVEFQCYIPESRVLDGGRPYVLPFLKNGHKVHVIPDSAIYHYLRKCDVALIGSETFYPDGTCFNTIGSEMTAFLCREFHIPFYVPTPLLKVDIRALKGHRKRPIIDDHTQRIGGTWKPEERENVDFICPELVAIDPGDITAYITEEGILPPWAMYSVSMSYYKRLMEKTE